ncbi:hypothetical protein HY572_00490 [Candidatus Micrarchaeota archaeon]|nr:hypothetical protein [Candidatus Micrarchaeota archaeon]
MSRISRERFHKIAEQVLGVLYDSFPIPLSTRKVAEEIARDNEFTLKVLLFLEQQKLVSKVDQGKTGLLERTVRWKISASARTKMG